MVTKQMMQGTWNEIVGRLRAKWGQLNRDDLEQFKGDTDSLAGYIQRHTGEAHEKIVRFLDDLLADGNETASRAADSLRDYASQAASSVKHGFDRVATQAREGYAGAEHFVQERPATSVGAAFFSGVLVGFVLAMLVRES